MIIPVPPTLIADVTSDTLLRAPDLIVLALYIVGIVGFGCWFARKTTNTEEFMAAGRSLAGWVVGLSIFGTYVSSISFLANPGKSFAANWNPFVFGLSLPIAAWIATRYFVPFYRGIGEISAYAHFENRFGPWARVYAVVCYLLTQLARMGTILYLVALALAPLTGWDVKLIIVVTGILVIVYTLLGGIEAVIWTDVVQSIVLTLGILVSLGVLIGRIPGGVAEVVRVAVEDDKFSLGSMSASTGESTFWVVLVFGLFMNLQNFGIDQSFVQRYFTAKSDRAAKRAVWLGALLYLPISALLFFVGTALYVFYRIQPDRLPEGVKSDAVFPHFIASELPAGVTGLLIAAVLAAAMSSVDSALNSSATLVLRDFYQRFFRPKAGDRESLRVLRATTVVWGVGGIAMALAMISVKNALDAWWGLAGVFSGGMLGLFLLGLVSRRAGNGAALVGVVSGVLVILWMSLSEYLPGDLAHLRNPMHSFMTIIVGTLVILGVGLAVGGRRNGELGDFESRN